jgi:hypothetical protein
MDARGGARKLPGTRRQAWTDTVALAPAASMVRIVGGTFLMGLIRIILRKRRRTASPFRHSGSMRRRHQRRVRDFHRRDRLRDAGGAGH